MCTSKCTFVNLKTCILQTLYETNLNYEGNGELTVKAGQRHSAETVREGVVWPSDREVLLAVNKGC